MHNGAFNWLEYFGLPEAYNHIGMTLLVSGALVLIGGIGRWQLARTMAGPDGGLVPDETWTFRNFLEIVAERMYGLTESVIGQHDAPIYFPLIGTLFLFIFISNVMGLIPGIAPSTENLNTTFALGFFVFIYYNYCGLKAHGLSYFKHFLGPVWWLAWLMLPIEIVSHVVRPVSLSLRLRGNIMGDHIVLGVFNGLVPYVVPVIFYGLGLFVAFIQAFVFVLLTMVYISLSSSHDH